MVQHKKEYRSSTLNKSCVRSTGLTNSQANTTSATSSKSSSQGGDVKRRFMSGDQRSRLSSPNKDEKFLGSACRLSFRRTMDAGSVQGDSGRTGATSRDRGRRSSISFPSLTPDETRWTSGKTNRTGAGSENNSQSTKSGERSTLRTGSGAGGLQFHRRRNPTRRSTIPNNHGSPSPKVAMLSALPPLPSSTADYPTLREANNLGRSARARRTINRQTAQTKPQPSTLSMASSSCSLASIASTSSGIDSSSGSSHIHDLNHSQSDQNSDHKAQVESIPDDPTSSVSGVTGTNSVAESEVDPSPPNSSTASSLGFEDDQDMRQLSTMLMENGNKEESLSGDCLDEANAKLAAIRLEDGTSEPGPTSTPSSSSYCSEALSPCPPPYTPSISPFPPSAAYYHPTDYYQNMMLNQIQTRLYDLDFSNPTVQRYFHQQRQFYRQIYDQQFAAAANGGGKPNGFVGDVYQSGLSKSRSAPTRSAAYSGNRKPPRYGGSRGDRRPAPPGFASARHYSTSGSRWRPPRGPGYTNPQHFGLPPPSPFPANGAQWALHHPLAQSIVDSQNGIVPSASQEFHGSEAGEPAGEDPSSVCTSEANGCSTDPSYDISCQPRSSTLSECTTSSFEDISQAENSHTQQRYSHTQQLTYLALFSQAR
ncbi:hypothetical protein DdX_07190 [Ditylenchus destructor]|uniref:Uncharacterized protein n=1 Tax=Ditylenchus destructor TaxID=166010 RepID=A0AAD4N4D6_9BILA|nr:hypothetical protein DdX_07190 [Ditylenchus destructor]